MPAFSSIADRRDDSFRRLKPSCVALSQAALALNGPECNNDLVTEKLEDLKQNLSSITATPDTLDEKLAEYVFFPISHVLRASRKVAIRSLELSLQCLSLLIQHGWRSKMQPQLAAQIVILCTLMGEKNPQGLASSATTEELRASALHCLHHLFSTIAKNSEAKAALNAEANVPQLGQTISIILDGVYESDSLESQTAGIDALLALVMNVATRDIQAGFLPGIVSKLTKVLTPQTKQRRNRRILIGALSILSHLFENTVGDDIVSSQSIDQAKKSHASPPGSRSRVIDEQWLKSASSRLKPAVTNILRLKDHDRGDVKAALCRFCLTVLRCRDTLSASLPMCLEAILILLSEPGGEAARAELESLIRLEPSYEGLLLDHLHNSLQSLPTRLQSSDERAKIQQIQQISAAYSISSNGAPENALITIQMANVLLDSVVVTLQTLGQKTTPLINVSQLPSLELVAMNELPTGVEFERPLVKHKAQEPIMMSIECLVHMVSCSSSSLSFAAELARSLRQSFGDKQMAAFWLLLESIQTTYGQNANLDDLTTFEPESWQDMSAHLEDLYSFSLEVLASPSEDASDVRLRALALRGLALRARAAGKDFRYELIDALYPVLHTLATPEEPLQKDSITTLNVFTQACGYHTVRELIVENVDYLTNAVALKLNAFDVSPQAPQVLLMMVRLAGPSLLPYLEDTIASIFSALEDYHGYPLLVELLFKVLSVVAEEGARAPQLAITGRATKHDVNRLPSDTWQPTNITGLAEYLKSRALDESITMAHSSNTAGSHPQRPWGVDENSEHTSDPTDDGRAEDVQDNEQPPDLPDPPPPAPKIYDLLLRISDLTQHFLPSASASLRTSLLGLIRTTIPAIAQHDNSFLPLINTLWPEIVSRLDDPEVHVSSAALDIIGLLCEHAKDFMRTRISQIWPTLVAIHYRAARDMTQTAQPVAIMSSKEQNLQSLVSGSDPLKSALGHVRMASPAYSDTSARNRVSATVRVLTSIVRYVPITPDMLDDTLVMLEPVLDEPNVRDALETANSDAVWLLDIGKGRLLVPDAPVLDGNSRWSFAAVG
jgi:hypothetical protein